MAEAKGERLACLIVEPAIGPKGNSEMTRSLFVI